LTLILDATPLIYLAKADALHLLKKLDDQKIVPATVHREVVEKGVEAGHPDASKVEKQVGEGNLSIRETKETDLLLKPSNNNRLSRADAEVLTLADSIEDGVAVMDETYGREIAESKNIEHKGTIHLLLQLLRNDTIDNDEARDIVDKMIDHGWYCSTRLYAKILKRLEKH